MSSQQTNAASNRAALARLQELSARVDRQDATIASGEAKNTAQDSILARHTEQIQSLEKAKDLTNQFSRLAHTELEAQKKRMDYLESLVRIGYAAGNVVPPQGILDDADVDLIAANAAIAGGDGDAIDLSAREHEIQKDPRLKALVNQSLQNLYGAPNLRDYSYLTYPSVSPDDEDWPSTKGPDGERIPYMRFDFAHRFSEPKNWERLQIWVNYILNHGATVTPVAQDILARLTHEDITTACKLRFSYLRGQFRQKSAANAAAAMQPPSTQLEANQPNEPAGGEASGGVPDNVIDPVLRGANEPPTTTLADLRSRAKGKCDIRTRKRNHLTEVNAQFKEAKYDSYFTPGAMSDDETPYENKDGTWVKLTDHFVSRPWNFYSKDLRDCRDAVDAVPDPNTRAHPTRRVRGDAKTGVPRKWEKVDWAMRKWMIDSGVLEVHPEWTKSGLVLGNGVAWGDAEEPAARNPAKRRKTKQGVSSGIGVAGPGPLTEQAREARRALQEAQQRAVEARDGETMEDIMMLLG